MQNPNQQSNNRIDQNQMNNDEQNPQINQSRAASRRNINRQAQPLNVLRLGATKEGILFIEQHKIIMLCCRNQIINPEQQSYLTMLKNIICPFFQYKSATFLLLVISTVMYIISLSNGLQQDKSLLQVTGQSLNKYGANNSKNIYAGQIYRLVSYLFLHINFRHYFVSMFFLLFLGSRVEYSFGSVRFMVYFFITGIAAGIFSNLLSPGDDAIKIGVQNSLYGLLGLTLGFMIINWPSFHIISPIFKLQLFCLYIFFFIFMSFFINVMPSLDSQGSLGGFLCGILLSGVHKSIDWTFREKLLRAIFIILLITQLLATFCIFYLRPSSAYS